MWVRALAGTQPIKAEPVLLGGRDGESRSRRSAPCGFPQYWNHAAGVERSGGCGGSSPRVPFAVVLQSGGGGIRGELEVPPVNHDDREDGRARQRARNPRAYARGIFLCTSWFEVCYLCVFACNRVTHLLMRNLASKDIGICAIYIQRFLVNLVTYLVYHIA